MLWKNGKSFRGECFKDLPDGFGEMNESKLNKTYEMYRGNLKSGKKHGIGILYSGILSEWENDKFVRIL